MNMKLWKLDNIGERLWSLSATTATVAAGLGERGRGIAVVAEETRRLANHVKGVVEQTIENDEEISSEKMVTYAEQLNYLALNTAIESARLDDGKQAAICADEIRNLANALGLLFDNDLVKNNIPGIMPWAKQPMTTVTTHGEFLLMEIAGIPVAEPLRNIVEIMVAGYTEMERLMGSIHARGRVLPLADGGKLLGRQEEAKTYVITYTPWAGQNSCYAVAARVSCIFVSPIGHPTHVPEDMPLAKFVRECWENENGEPFYFMDWAKMAAEMATG